MIVAKQVADLLTGIRVVLAFSFVVVGVTQGVESLPLAIWILIACWVTDCLDGPLARRAIEMGIKLAINTDAHYPAMYDIQEYGVFTARRGWVTAESVLNAWPLEKLQRWLKTRET